MSAVRTFSDYLLYNINNVLGVVLCCLVLSQSQWPRGLRRTSAAARLQRLWLRIPPGA